MYFKPQNLSRLFHKIFEFAVVKPKMTKNRVITNLVTINKFLKVCGMGSCQFEEIAKLLPCG